jgi:hypothetical protein
MNPTTSNYRQRRRLVEEEKSEEYDSDDSRMIPGAFRIGGNDDDDDATFQTESLDLCLPPPADSSAALLLQGELSPDIDEEIAVAVSAVCATTIEVVDEDGEATPTPTWSLSRRSKLEIATYILFVIGIAATISILFSRNRFSPGCFRWNGLNCADQAMMDLCTCLLASFCLLS